MELRLLNDADLEAIHRVATAILGEMGMLVQDEETRALLQRAGCREGAGGYLLYPEALVERALETVPSRMVLYDREGKVAVDSRDREPHFGPGLNSIDFLDHRTGEHRPCTARDVEDIGRVCEGLPHIDFAAGLGNPSDVPAAEQAMVTVRALVETTVKPIAFIGHDEVESQEIWGTLADVVGGWEALAERPCGLDLTGPRSPLELGQEACRRLRFAARHRLPVVCYPALTTGASGPITLAGALAQSAAEILGGLVVHQLEEPGAPVISGSAVLPMDMRSGAIAYGSPEYVLACLGAVDYFNSLDVPSWFGAGCSDAHTVDVQAAAEAGMSMQTAVVSGTSFIHNLGYLSAGKTASLEMLVLCDELAGLAKRFAAGVRVDEETLGWEVIRRSYRDHSFLSDKHTVDHVRTAMWYPALCQRGPVEEWMAAGSVGMGERVREKLGSLLGG